ncbi:MAG: ATP-grasp domain-containing protein [Candidatus Hydrogenedens sp.]|nr:ATP-grasp domain-containing protein [Candidatus Hydrogenedens sp.]
MEVFGGASKNTEYDPARQWLRNYVECPWFEDPEFASKFQALLREHDINYVIPAWDPLVEMFASWDVPGITFITPRAEIASLCMTKTATYERLRSLVPVPAVYGETPVLPAFAKPDRGSGSRNIRKVETTEDYALARAQGLLLTEYLPGDEYTVDCLSDPNGALLVASVRQRAVLGQGVAIGTIGHPGHLLEAHCCRIAEELRIEGPWFAQFKADAAGTLKLIEINARIGGSTGHTRLNGVNIPLMSLFAFSGDTVRVPHLRTGVRLSRCLSFYCEPLEFNAVLWDLDDTLIRKDGKPDPEVVAKLYDCANRGKRQFLVSKNPDPVAALQAANIPDLFERVLPTSHKPDAIRGLLRDHALTPEECLMVNDSYQETFEIQATFPGMMTITPDAVEALGRERLA